jgi:hypothetical protein
MRRLKIYNDQNHPHQAQNPIEIDISNFYSNPQFSYSKNLIYYLKKNINSKINLNEKKNNYNLINLFEF